MGKKVVFMVDMESFYASVEKARYPEYRSLPLVVSGDPERRSGVILAACPLAKKRGVKNAERLWEAKQKCPEAVVVRPRMQDYVDISMGITAILERYTDLVEPFSIDEQFMDVTNSQRLFGSPLDIAKKIQTQIWTEMRVRARIGIGENKVIAKMACDHFAKKNDLGIYWLKKENIQQELWPLPIGKLFGVGSKMEHHFKNRGIRTIGHLAETSLEKLKKRWGINGHILWMTANGVDLSPVSKQAHDRQKAIGHAMTLPRDYISKADIKVVLLELCEEVCKRARMARLIGQTVSVHLKGASFDCPTGFNRQLQLPYMTNITMELYKYACQLLDTFWDHKPIRRVGVSLTKLAPDSSWQMSFLDKRDRLHRLGYVMDEIKNKYGETAILRASSKLHAGQAEERSKKIGGHYK